MSKQIILLSMSRTVFYRKPKTLSLGREFTFLYIHSLNVSHNKIGFTFSWCMVWVNYIIKILPSNDDGFYNMLLMDTPTLWQMQCRVIALNLLLPFQILEKTFFPEITFLPPYFVVIKHLCLLGKCITLKKLQIPAWLTTSSSD